MGLVLACATVLVALPGLPALRSEPTPAATAAPAASAADTPPASPTPAAAPLDPLDVATLRKHVNETVEVRGTPLTIGQNKNKTIAYLNFAGAHQAMSLVFFLKPGETGKAGTGDDVKPFVGKAILVHGKLTDYKGDLQIAVDSLDQIKVAP